jgi:uncharacterized LabA/DUF88 family protein
MIVYIDGENVVHQLTQLLGSSKTSPKREVLLRLNIRKLLQKILKDKNIKIRYYTTALRLVKTDPILEKKSREMMKWSGDWANSLVKQDIAIIKAGKLKVRESEPCPRCGFVKSVFREKGVDVRLAVDMVTDSMTEKNLVVWSSDADLLPAVQVAKRNGARVKNIASKESLNWALAKQCGEWQFYRKSDIKIGEK